MWLLKMLLPPFSKNTLMSFRYACIRGTVKGTHGSTARFQAPRYIYIYINSLFYVVSLFSATVFINYSSIFKTEKKGGYKTYVMEIKGKRVYSKLKYESGVHRVQRVPQTETQGRVHTSTATVAIMPEVSSLYALPNVLIYLIFWIKHLILYAVV